MKLNHLNFIYFLSLGFLTADSQRYLNHFRSLSPEWSMRRIPPHIQKLRLRSNSDILQTTTVQSLPFGLQGKGNVSSLRELLMETAIAPMKSVGPLARITSNINTAQLPCCRDRFGETACQSLRKSQPALFEKRFVVSEFNKSIIERSWECMLYARHFKFSIESKTVCLAVFFIIHIIRVFWSSSRAFPSIVYQFYFSCLSDHDFSSIDCCGECRKYIERNNISAENSKSIQKAPSLCKDKHSIAFCRRFKSAGMGKFSCSDAEFAVRVCRHSCGYCNDELYMARNAPSLCAETNKINPMINGTRLYWAFGRD